MQKQDIKIAINNISNICRVCLKENEFLESVYNVHVEDAQYREQLDLVKVFKKYCGLEITPTDLKPQRICQSCITLLCQSYSFFERILWANKVLDDVLQDSKQQKLQNSLENLKEEFSEESKHEIVLIEESTTRISNKTAGNISESEEDTFFDNNKDDSDWEPAADDIANMDKTKKKDILEKEEESSDEDETLAARIARKRKVESLKQPVRKRGRPRKKITDNRKRVHENDDNIFPKPDLECRLCGKSVENINSAIDHYDDKHAPEMERDECILCDKPKSYKKRDNLLYHMGLHSRDSFKCIPCRMYFRDKEALEDHLKHCFKVVEKKINLKSEDSGDETENIKSENTIDLSNSTGLSKKVLSQTQYDGAFKCQLCKIELGKINNVVDHYEEAHLDDLHCIICLRAFTKHVPLFHIGLHSKNSHICRPCRLFFRTKEDYDIHNSKFDHDKSLSCRICGKTFTRNYKKNKHMLSHLKEKNYSCNKCGKTFTYKTSLVRHFKQHFGKRFLCSSCGNSYTTKFMLQKHFDVVHRNVDADGNPLPKPPPKPVHLQCEFCGEIFNTKYGYGRHIRRHPEFTQYKCKICSYTCDSKGQLDQHMEAKHNKHTCKVCGKRFAFESELKTHFRKHEDMESARFRCEVCGKTARTQTQLKVHFRIHTGERPFSCDICHKSFKQTAHLKVHMYQHTGKMPFKCGVCEKTFPFQHIMEIHMRTHTGEKPFQCLFCGNAYHDRTTMQKHHKKKHPEIPLQKMPRNDYKMTKLDQC